MEDKKKTSKGKTPHYNANGIKAPRYNIKGIGKVGPSLGGVKGAQVAPSPGQGNNAALTRSIGKSLMSNLGSRKAGKERG